MEELKNYDKAKITKSTEELKKLLEKHGLKASHFPESLEDFDELELRFELNGDFDLCFCITIFNREVQRMMLVKVSKREPDRVLPPEEKDLTEFKDKYLSKVLSFLKEVTS